MGGGIFRARCHRPRRFVSGGSAPQELGIPTANLDRSCLHGQLAQAVTGIYGGWAAIGHSSTVYPMVMSVGFNPFYGNKVPSVPPGHSHASTPRLCEAALVTSSDSSSPVIRCCFSCPRFATTFLGQVRYPAWREKQQNWRHTLHKACISVSNALVISE